MKISNDIAAVVTGGASGLGFASAKALREAGARVTIFDLNAEKGQAAADEIGAAFAQVDVLDEDKVLAGFESARAANGQERILVNCAGGGSAGKILSRDRKTGEIKRMKTDEFEWNVRLNLVSTFRCIAISGQGMMSLEPLEDGERGTVINTGSVAAQDGQVGQVSYASAKAGIAGLTLPVARDLSSEGIRVNTILPGTFATPPMLAAPQNVLDALGAAVPFPPRLGKPEEFGSLVLEIVRNVYFNAHVFRLDGGIRMPPR
jgi:NAD(P)-dependent dehydrogenase (short-subunit alcohol dehydrogenase family)